MDGALGPQNLHRLPELLHAAVEPAGEARAGYFEDGPHFSGDLAARRERPFQAWVQVMSGCTNFCSYCIVPYVRGPERSRRVDELADEVESLVADGVREVTLLGQNVNAYGLDLRHGGEADAPAFAGLLRRLDAIDGLERIRFMTSHPKDLGDDLVAAVAELPSVCEHVHLPAQAGSDSVLRAMRRGYSAGRYLERLRALRAAVPDVSITTDLIAGFPGETEARLREDAGPGQGGGVRRRVHVRLLATLRHQRRGTAGPGAPGGAPRARGAPHRAHAAVGAGVQAERGSADAPKCSSKGASRDGACAAGARARTSP